MSSFAERCGFNAAAHEAAVATLLQQVRDEGLHSIRIGWCDLHGMLRGKTLLPRALPSALRDGLGMVSTLLLKDSSDRTAFKVFEPGALGALNAQGSPGAAGPVGGFGMANNLLLLPDPGSLHRLPWAPGTGWLRAEAWFADATPVPLDPRRALQRAVASLADAGYALQVGLEVEFHVYRLAEVDGQGADADPQRAAWPGEPPAVRLLHPGYNLLSENWSDRCAEVFEIVRRVCDGLQLPLRSLEIELGPSQIEAVFDAADALVAADRMVLFRNGVAQALRRAGYHASFMCRPPFPAVMASGWHLHQSLRRLADGAPAFMPDAAAATAASPGSAAAVLAPTGQAWLAGLLEHAAGAAALASSTVNAFGRFRPNAMAPQAVVWGRDNRGAAFRVLGGAGDAASRIENRIGEPMANPYLYIASQIHAGLDGLRRGLQAPPATESPYAEGLPMLPGTLGAALDALAADAAMAEGFGAPLLAALIQVKRAEQARFDAAADKDDWQRREYFSRF